MHVFIYFFLCLEDSAFKKKKKTQNNKISLNTQYFLRLFVRLRALTKTRKALTTALKGTRVLRAI